ncbi:MAG: hypothetical protein NTW17_01870 [Candidatus Pacearchaeota archaeon]|nr:hypothetical protein [Candidatus Pacearchaeota archaeon]
MDLDDCYKKEFIKKTRINTSLISSLIEMSAVNEKTVKEAKISEINISSYIVLAYESLREILEAICISKGYKVLSHACLGELLKELIKDFDFNEFDRLRYARNGVNYYGTKVELKQGKELIKKAFNMKNDLLGRYLRNFR